VYFQSILETVQWLGFEPHAITYSSDHFQRLYELAVELIKRDKAYVCHSTGAEMHAQRGGDAKGARFDSPWRNRPIEESLREFQRMKDGCYKEGEATLRMKMDMQHASPQFWDLVAYRVLYTPHVRTKSAWCIYPTYDYTHCLCDSFEDITHSMCTTEFILNRESYYWLVDALELYKPVQWEYGRLKLTNTVLSKRKLMQLVDQKIVDGWDDPRLFTLQALRRRGFTPPAINAFVRELGVTTANATIPVARLENYVRDHLNETASRLMVLPSPLKVVLTNLPEDYEEEVVVPNHPKDASLGTRALPFTQTLFIDASDFREQDDPDFFRLAPGKTVGLLHVPHPITATDFVRDAAGRVVQVNAVYAHGKKAKTYIQWVGKSLKRASPVQIELRQYANLFLHADPDSKEQVPGGWLSDINPHSLEILPSAYADIGVLQAQIEQKFQFLRIGYFCVDLHSVPSSKKYIFNKTVSLKEDSKKT
jgi:glutaminyl-tRNA synthetase